MKSEIANVFYKARIEELEGILETLLGSGVWYKSALEIDVYNKDVMDGEALEKLITETLKRRIE
jgi:hypothetical protein